AIGGEGMVLLVAPDRLGGALAETAIGSAGLVAGAGQQSLHLADEGGRRRLRQSGEGGGARFRRRARCVVELRRPPVAPRGAPAAAAVGPQPIPGERLDIGLDDAGAGLIGLAQGELRRREAALGGLGVPARRLAGIGGDAVARLVDAAEV